MTLPNISQGIQALYGLGLFDQVTADLLKGMGVDYIQGYHIGRPIPLNDALERRRQPVIAHEAVSC